MFNLSGSEIVFLMIIGLVVLGPEKLPTALRKAGRLYGEFRRITSGAESEFRSAFAEPLRELKDTASGYKTMFTDAAAGITNIATDVKSSFTVTTNEASIAKRETEDGEITFPSDIKPAASKSDGTNDIVDGM